LEEFKANEMAKKVMSRYENYHKEIKDIISQDTKQVKNQEFGNFYTFLFKEQNFIAKKMLI